jgi:hypothetical protein
LFYNSTLRFTHDTFSLIIHSIINFKIKLSTSREIYNFLNNEKPEGLEESL